MVLGYRKVALAGGVSRGASGRGGVLGGRGLPAKRAAGGAAGGPGPALERKFFTAHRATLHLDVGRGYQQPLVCRTTRAPRALALAHAPRILGSTRSKYMLVESRPLPPALPNPLPAPRHLRPWPCSNRGHPRSRRTPRQIRAARRSCSRPHAHRRMQQHPPRSLTLLGLPCAQRLALAAQHVAAARIAHRGPLVLCRSLAVVLVRRPRTKVEPLRRTKPHAKPHAKSVEKQCAAPV